jgi:hypothetical protein
MEAGMKVLTIKNPWADWIINGLAGLHKTTENRTWETRYRGRIMIHVSKTLDYNFTKRLGFDPSFLVRWEKQKGHIIGTVELYAIDRQMKTQWDEPGLFHWRLRDPVPLGKPILARGALGLWEYTGPVDSSVRAEHDTRRYVK